MRAPSGDRSSSTFRFLSTRVPSGREAVATRNARSAISGVSTSPVSTTPRQAAVGARGAARGSPSRAARSGRRSNSTLRLFSTSRPSGETRLPAGTRDPQPPACRPRRSERRRAPGRFNSTPSRPGSAARTSRKGSTSKTTRRLFSAVTPRRKRSHGKPGAPDRRPRPWQLHQSARHRGLPCALLRRQDRVLPPAACARARGPSRCPGCSRPARLRGATPQPAAERAPPLPASPRRLQGDTPRASPVHAHGPAVQAPPVSSWRRGLEVEHDRNVTLEQGPVLAEHRDGGAAQVPAHDEEHAGREQLHVGDLG